MLGQERQLRRRRRDRHDPAAAGHRRIHRRQDLSLLRAPGHLARDCKKAAGRDAAREQLRDRAAARDDLPVEGFLQPAVRRHAHQEPGRAGRIDLQEAGPDSKSPACPISTTPPRRWASICSLRPPWPAGRRAAAGSRPACCSSAAISPTTSCFPTSAFIPPDRYPVYPTGDEIRAVHEKIRAGMDISTATKPEAKDEQDMMADVEHDGRPRRGLQHALRQLSRLADGDGEGQADSARHRRSWI